MQFDTDVVSTPEDGSSSNFLVVSLRGTPSAAIVVTPRLLTFSQYQSYRANFSSSFGLQAPDLSTSFPQLPSPASVDDFLPSVSQLRLTNSGSATLIPLSGLVVDDSEAEFTEGFVVFLEISEDDSDQRDLARLTAPVPLALVTIEDNDRMLCIPECSKYCTLSAL